jgi:hypothetical protein
MVNCKWLMALTLKSILNGELKMVNGVNAACAKLQIES